MHRGYGLNRSCAGITECFTGNGSNNIQIQSLSCYHWRNTQILVSWMDAHGSRKQRTLMPDWIVWVGQIPKEWVTILNVQLKRLMMQWPMRQMRHILLDPGVHYNGHFSWCFESWWPIYWTSINYHNFNIIDIQKVLTLKIMVILLRMLYHFYLEFEDKFKSFVKFGLNTFYNKMEI